MSTTTERLAQPALVGGLVMGVLTALPIISAGNLCCCLWVLSGGAVAAYMRRLLRDIAEGKALGDTTTLADPGVVAKLKDMYEASEG